MSELLLFQVPNSNYIVSGSRSNRADSDRYIRDVLCHSRLSLSYSHI